MFHLKEANSFKGSRGKAVNGVVEERGEWKI